MKNFNNCVKNICVDLIKPFEDYSNTITEKKNTNIKGKVFEFDNCTNSCLILEDSLSRTLNYIKTKDFAIITAYRGNHTKNENIIRNRMLRSELNKYKIRVHQLVGHWQEAPDGKDYKDCNKSELNDVVERSYLVVRPDDMVYEDFKNLIMSLSVIDGEKQDAVLIKNENGMFLYYNANDFEKIGNDISLNKINQAYSQHVKNNMPFVFEGIETPITNFGKQIFKLNNILY